MSTLQAFLVSIEDIIFAINASENIYKTLISVVGKHLNLHSKLYVT